MPPASLILRDFQLRRPGNLPALEALEASILRFGIIEPLIVRQVGAGLELISGHRRLEAARRLDLPLVPVIVTEISDEDVVLFALHENQNQAEMNPVEEALAFCHLLNSGRASSQKDLAKIVGVSPGRVSQMLGLLSFPAAILELFFTPVNGGTPLTEKHARTLKKILDLDHALDFAKLASSVDGPSEDETFTYDANGNITTYWSTTTGTVTSTYNDADQLEASTNATYSYDDLGNLVAKFQGADLWQYLYNGASRLSQVDKNGTWEAKYSYYPHSPMWRTRQANGEAKPLFFVNDGMNTVFDYKLPDFGFGILEEARYIQLPALDEPLMIRDPGTSDRWFYHQNNVGSVTRVTDGGGAVDNSYTYSAYGRELSASESVGSRFRYTGREWDPRANLYYYRNRWYDPGTAHFSQYDPIGHDGGVNLYGYVDGNPVRLTDPLGEVPADTILDAIVVADDVYEFYCEPTGENFVEIIQSGCWAMAPYIPNPKICKVIKKRRFKSRCEKQAQWDEAICRSMPTGSPSLSGARSRCWASVQARYGACQAGLPLPPLVTW